MIRTFTAKVFTHVVLVTFTALAITPVAMVVMNSFKGRRDIFRSPYKLPNSESLDLVGYETVFERSDFFLYYQNSLVITVVSLFLILLLGAMVAHAISEYSFPGNTFILIFFLLGIIIPIRLGSVSLLRLIVGLDLVDTLLALILVYTAQGLPLSVFILSQFMRQVPGEIKDSARIDGANEYRIFTLVIPLIRPAMATVAIMTMIPIWNDLWFPLILTSSPKMYTVTVGAQQFMGQFANDWNAILAALSLAALPVLALYFVFSRQILRGLTTGAIK